MESSSHVLLKIIAQMLINGHFFRSHHGDFVKTVRNLYSKKPKCEGPSVFSGTRRRAEILSKRNHSYR